MHVGDRGEVEVFAPDEGPQIRDEALAQREVSRKPVGP
jgi:hypothetical protein